MAETEILTGWSTGTTWEPIPHRLRWINTIGRVRQGVMTVLQMAWRCREDGRIEWRAIPHCIVNEDEYSP